MFYFIFFIRLNQKRGTSSNIFINNSLNKYTNLKACCLYYLIYNLNTLQGLILY